MLQSKIGGWVFFPTKRLEVTRYLGELRLWELTLLTSLIKGMSCSSPVGQFFVVCSVLLGLFADSPCLAKGYDS